MATHSHDSGTTTGSLGAFARFSVVVLFTGVETAVLAVWLALVRDAPATSRLAAVGLGVLVAGLTVEHVLTDLAVNGSGLSLPGVRVVLVSVTEAALWAAWLVVAERVGGIEGLVLAAVVLAVLLVPQHTVEDNVLRGDGLFSDLLDSGTLGFSVIEAAGATVWLAAVEREGLLDPVLAAFGVGGVDSATAGLAVLALALFVEHSVGVRFARRG